MAWQQSNSNRHSCTKQTGLEDEIVSSHCCRGRAAPRRFGMAAGWDASSGSPGRGWVFRDSILGSHSSNSNTMRLINKILCDKYSIRSIYIMYCLIIKCCESLAKLSGHDEERGATSQCCLHPGSSLWLF